MKTLTLEYRVMRIVYSLMKEAVQDNTQNALRSAVITLSNGTRASLAIKASKFPLYKVAVERMSTNYSIGSRIEKDFKRAKDNAARLVGVVNFLLQVEDIHSTIDKNVATLTTKRQEYLDDLKQQYPDREPNEPTVERFLRNEYRPFRMQFLNLLNNRSSLTKDPPTILFHKSTQDLYNSQYDLISTQSYDTFCKQLLKLTMEQLIDLSKKIQTAIPRIAQIKRVVGQSSSEELRTNFFHIPPEEAKKIEVPDQPTIKTKF